MPNPPFPITSIQIQQPLAPNRRHDCHRLVQCGVAIDARFGTSDLDNSCPVTKPELSYKLDAGRS
jgi:hypothetical protein